MPEDRDSKHHPLPEWLRDDADAAQVQIDHREGDDVPTRSERDLGNHKSATSPMRPIPDGGLSTSMPTWLARKDGSNDSEGEMPDESTPPLDVTSFLSDEDLPDWLRTLASSSTAPPIDRQATPENDPSEPTPGSAAFAPDPMPPLITSRQREPAPDQDRRPNRLEVPRPLHDFNSPAPPREPFTSRANSPGLASSRDDPDGIRSTPTRPSEQPPRPPVWADDGHGPLIFLVLFGLAALAIVLVVSTR